MCYSIYQVNVREYRRGSQERTIQRNRQHRVYKTKKNKEKTQYVLDTTMRKQLDSDGLCVHQKSVCHPTVWTGGNCEAGSANSREPDFIRPGFSGVRVSRSLVFCVMFCRSFLLFSVPISHKVLNNYPCTNFVTYTNLN